MAYSTQERLSLLQIALGSIESGLRSGAPETVNCQDYSRELRELRACFVTLKKDQSLRGCIGSLEAHRSLVEDVASNAFAAAFRDPRFQKLGNEELDFVDIGISVLTPGEALIFDSQQTLLDMLRPGQDGLVLQDRNARGTFLPAVWESLPQPEEFLKQLKIKAGLPADYWSETLQVWRYTTESFNAPVSEIRGSNESSVRTE
jgi:AmmeMemoRadiSam system protein A